MDMGTATKQQKKVPELRFPQFSNEWTPTKLGEIAEVKRGAASQHLTYVSEENEQSVRLIRINDFLSNNPVYVVDTEDMGRFVLQKNDLLIAGTGATAGIVFIVPDTFVGMSYSYNAPRIRVRNGMSHRFVYEYLKSEIILRQQKSLFVGNAQPFLDTDAIRGLRINLPETEEQQKIADFLGSVDAWLDNLRQQKTALETYKTGCMQKLFAQQVRFKDDNGNDFPEWVAARLGDLGEVKTSSVDKLSNEGETNVNLLNYMDVYRRDHIYNSDEFQTVTATDRERTSFSLKQGDILFTPSSETPTDIGHSAVVMEDLDNVLFSYHLLRFRPKSGVFSGGFGGYAFKSFNFYKELWRRAQGATRYTLSLESMKEAEVAYPASIEEQNKITDLLTAIDQTISAKAEEITLVEQWKKGLMQKMFI